MLLSISTILFLSHPASPAPCQDALPCSFCSFIFSAKIFSSNSIPCSASISLVRSGGNPYVSYNLKAFSPDKTSFELGFSSSIKSFRIVNPCSTVLPKFSSSIFIIFLIYSSLFSNSKYAPFEFLITTLAIS